MKKLLWIIAAMATTGTLAQENTPKAIVTVEEQGTVTKVKIPGIQIHVDENSDTLTRITLGHKRFDIIEKDNRTQVSMVRLPRSRFKGHYTGVTLAYNWYVNQDFNTSFGADHRYMDLDRGKSMSFGIHPLQYSFGLQKHKNTIGVVLGAGWTVHNYRFDHNYLLQKNEEGVTVGELAPFELSKNKLTVSYINIPLLFEFQIPTRQDQHRIVFDLGAYIGFKIGSHTKVVYSENGSREKDKDRPNLNIRPIQYGAMAQFGMKNLKLFATYNFSSLFSIDKGPEVYPIQVGLAFLTF